MLFIHVFAHSYGQLAAKRQEKCDVTFVWSTRTLKETCDVKYFQLAGKHFCLRNQVQFLTSRLVNISNVVFYVVSQSVNIFMTFPYNVSV